MGFLQTSFRNPQCLKYFHNFVLKKVIQGSNVLLNSQSTVHVFPASYMTFTKQVTSQHHSPTHPQTSDHLFTHTKSHSWFLKERKSFSTTLKNAKNPSVIVKFTQDLNLDEIKEQVKKERLTTPGVQVITKIKEVLAERCDQAIANMNEEEKKALKVIQLEHSFLFSQGYFIPSLEEMTSENWLEAMQIDSKMQRHKYYIFLKKKLMLKASDKEHKEAKKDDTNTTPEQRGLGRYEHGTLFMRIYDTTIKKWQNYNLASAMQFGIPLVIDMDYHDFMRTQDSKNTATQLFSLYSLNRSDTNIPFHLHFTNCPENNPLYRLMLLQMQDTPDILATVSEKSYLDLFDKDKLVYLSPDAKMVMTKFDPEAVYIIGAFNDKGTQQPVSYARAKKQGIKTMRFPLDQYLNWNLGSKSITLDQVMQIMTALKNKESWLDAFKSIPRRKIRS